MVEVVETDTFSNHREQTKYRQFPQHELDKIVAAVEGVDHGVFVDSEPGRELRVFDDEIATRLPEYEYEHAGDAGRNPATKLWRDSGFDHSVDLYHPEKRIAIEIEKSERKRVSDDLLKFIKGGKTYRNGRNIIEFGCLILPTNYRGNGNIYGGVLTTLDFMRAIIYVEDIAMVGYRDPRWQ